MHEVHKQNVSKFSTVPSSTFFKFGHYNETLVTQDPVLTHSRAASQLLSRFLLVSSLANRPVEVRALCRPLGFFYRIPDKAWLYGFVMLENSFVQRPLDLVKENLDVKEDRHSRLIVCTSNYMGKTHIWE